MTTHVRHLPAKFADDPTELFQLITHLDPGTTNIQSYEIMQYESQGAPKKCHDFGHIIR